MRLLAFRPRAAPPPDLPPGPPGPTPPWRRLWRVPRLGELRLALRENPGLKLISLLLAFFLWFSINLTERDAERIVDLPVVIRQIQQGLVVTNPPTKPVGVTLRGPRTILDGVDEQRLRLGLDLATATAGDQRIELTTDMLRPELPRRLKLVRFEPARLKIVIEPVLRRRILLKAELAGTPALGYMVAESHVSPTEAEVAGPASKVKELKEITTEPVELRGLSETFERDVLLSWAGEFVSLTPDHVLVTVTFEEVMVSREFKHVDVGVVNREGAETQVMPARIDLTVRGPQRLLHNYKIPTGAVYVDAAGVAPGTHRVSVHVDLPAKLEVTRREPEVHLLRISPAGPR